MGTYVGAASLVDGGHTVGVRVSLASAAPDGTRWFGSVQGLAHLDLDGHDVVIELPNGARGRASVVIDLTGVTPEVRLVGTGPSPV